MANKVAELKSALGVAARPNKYRINMAVPAAVSTTSDLSVADVLCKASSFPAMTIGQIELWNQGRKLPIPGDTTYTTTWELTFYLTEDHKLRKDMLAWMRYIDHYQNNSRSGNLDAIMGELSVEQLDSSGEPTVRYTFHNAFVQEVGEVTIADDQVDTALEFTVTFSFSDWVVGDSELNDTAAGADAAKNDTAE